MGERSDRHNGNKQASHHCASKHNHGRDGEVRPVAVGRGRRG